MPELPEVETIVRELKQSAVGKVFSGVEIMDQKVISPEYDSVKGDTEGLEILDVRRRGKFIVMELSKGMRLVVHLRMTGRLMWSVEKGRAKYVRARFDFEDGEKLYFSDVRRFGKIWMYDKNSYQKVSGIERLGIEPMEMSFSEFNSKFRGRRGILKNTLLRQDLIAGIGNIYADEVCFRIGINPKSRIEKLSKDKVEQLYDAVKVCLAAGIENCGVSMSDFVGTKGDLGKHQDYLKVYGREGDSCYQCGEPIFKTKVAGRGTYYCKDCQKVL